MQFFAMQFLSFLKLHNVLIMVKKNLHIHARSHASYTLGFQELNVECAMIVGLCNRDFQHCVEIQVIRRM